MPDGGAVVVGEPAQVGVGLKIHVLRLEAFVERHEVFRKMIEEVQGQVGSTKPAPEPKRPLTGAHGAFRAAPGQQARADAGPGHAGDEEPNGRRKSFILTGGREFVAIGFHEKSQFTRLIDSMTGNSE